MWVLRSVMTFWQRQNGSVWIAANRQQKLLQKVRCFFYKVPQLCDSEVHFPDLPNCWMARSALHGSSKVMWTLRLWFFTRLSACREIPELAASEMMATNCNTQAWMLMHVKQTDVHEAAPQEIVPACSCQIIQQPTLSVFKSKFTLELFFDFIYTYCIFLCTYLLFNLFILYLGHI